MENKRKIHVYSEIGKLKTVMLHRPGREIENLVPDYLERLLFDDIPYLKVAKDEHDNFANVLRMNGVEVLYLEKLVSEALHECDVKEKFLKEVIYECDIKDEDTIKVLIEYFKSMPTKAMVDKIMAGVRKKEIGLKENSNEYPFIMDPMPNLYFTRDPFATIGSGVSVNSMRTKTRKRETIFGKYIFNYHPEYKDSGIKYWYDRTEKYSVEGGDELILSDEVIAIGASERTDKQAAMKIAKKIFESNEGFNTLLIFDIPKSRAFMHLDTVFTMIDYDKFTVHPGIEGGLKVTALTYDEKNNDVKAVEEEGTLEKILSSHLKRDITLIRCGGGDQIIAGREQWNDGSNTLAIAPGKVITYERNYVTNELLDKYNIEVIAIPSSELSRGRGGPRCMSMPFYREDCHK
ncbi:arginine deiminase [Clostridium tepidiprofundi DSM 19306]|uniref:Arginine deiminase n=1 Tax=Clostridium tepidiprofundi DSM 19306 TaxID=1121338 RepID=A0A151B3F2_9CLOT|nr:arginine deiminase [Clostridium tepidiprofundi]KYH34177.1 arginine deiminase [Clostridium tepidiprofundi DSM 19306]